MIPLYIETRDPIGLSTDVDARLVSQAREVVREQRKIAIAVVKIVEDGSPPGRSGELVVGQGREAAADRRDKSDLNRGFAHMADRLGHEIGTHLTIDHQLKILHHRPADAIVG